MLHLKKIAAFHSPIRSLIQQSQNQIDQIVYLAKENTFFASLLLKAEAFSTGRKLQLVKGLQEQLALLKIDSFYPLQMDWEKHLEALQQQLNCKYPPCQLSSFLENHQNLRDQYDEQYACFKALKINIFDTVDEFLTIQIF